jgi:hypothetical protein
VVAVTDFVDRAKDFADERDQQLDEGLEKVGDQVDQRTEGRYGEQVDRGVDEAQRRTGDGDLVE